MTTTPRSATASYLGATTDVLSLGTGVDKVAAGVSRKEMFRRRGDIWPYPDRLVLRNWSDDGDLTLRPTDTESVETRCTELYGRFIGGLLDPGKPLIVRFDLDRRVLPAEQPYGVMESTDDLEWEKLTRTWLADQHRA